jgi:hypothetical protein
MINEYLRPGFQLFPHLARLLVYDVGAPGAILSVPMLAITKSFVIEFGRWPLPQDP